MTHVFYEWPTSDDRLIIESPICSRTSKSSLYLCLYTLSSEKIVVFGLLIKITRFCESYIVQNMIIIIFIRHTLISTRIIYIYIYIEILMNWSMYLHIKWLQPSISHSNAHLDFIFLQRIWNTWMVQDIIYWKMQFISLFIGYYVDDDDKGMQILFPSRNWQ